VISPGGGGNGWGRGRGGREMRREGWREDMIGLESREIAD